MNFCLDWTYLTVTAIMRQLPMARLIITVIKSQSRTNVLDACRLLTWQVGYQQKAYEIVLQRRYSQTKYGSHGQ